MLNIYEISKLRQLFNDGYSYREIEHLTGCNYRTIKKYVELEDFKEPEVFPTDFNGVPNHI